MSFRPKTPKLFIKNAALVTISRRDLLALAAAAAAASAATRTSAVRAAGKPAPAQPSTDLANQSPGTEVGEHVWNALPGAGQREFPLNDPSITEIFGYTEWLSYAPGESVKLFTHTTASTYDIEVVRDGLKPLKVWSSTGQRGIRQQTPEDAYAIGCRWLDPVVIRTEPTWPSGFYLVILRTRDQAGRILEREAGFILRPPNGQRTQRLALIWTSATATAYNDWGGANSYRTVINGVSKSILAPRLSLQRPWARGLLRLPSDAPRISDVPDLPPFAAPQYPFVEWALKNGYSRHYSDAGWAYYERPFVLWAEQNGYQFDYLSQHDLQLRPDCLNGYRGAVIMGHDEYWPSKSTVWITHSGAAFPIPPMWMGLPRVWRSWRWHRPCDLNRPLPTAHWSWRPAQMHPPKSTGRFSILLKTSNMVLR